TARGYADEGAVSAGPASEDHPWLSQERKNRVVCDRLAPSNAAAIAGQYDGDLCHRCRIRRAITGLREASRWCRRRTSRRVTGDAVRSLWTANRPIWSGVVLPWSASDFLIPS